MHLNVLCPPIKPPDFCETDIVFEVDAEGSQPRIETLTTYRETSQFDYLLYLLVVKSQLHNVFQKDSH